MFSEDALAEERILSGGYTVGGVGEVMECGLAVCKAVCCGAERFFSLGRLFARAVVEAWLLDRECTWTCEKYRRWWAFLGEINWGRKRRERKRCVSVWKYLFVVASVEILWNDYNDFNQANINLLSKYRYSNGKISHGCTSFPFQIRSFARI